MIGIDTNVLVRYIVQDEPKQARAATDFLENTLTAEEPGRICLVVLCELSWVLSRAYHYERAAIAHVLEKLLTAAELEVEHSAVAWRALRDYRTGPAEFADYIIAHLNSSSAVEYTITLDRKAARHALFREVVL